MKISRREARKILTAATHAEEHYKSLRSHRDILEGVSDNPEWQVTIVSLDEVREKFEQDKRAKMSEREPEVYTLSMTNPYALQFFKIFIKTNS